MEFKDGYIDQGSLQHDIEMLNDALSTAGGERITARGELLEALTGLVKLARRLIPGTREHRTTPLNDAIIDCAETNRGTLPGIETISKKLKRRAADVRAAIAELVDAEILTVRGEGRNRCYVLTEWEAIPKADALMVVAPKAVPKAKAVAPKAVPKKDVLKPDVVTPAKTSLRQAVAAAKAAKS